MAEMLTSEVKLPYSRRLVYGITVAGLCLAVACCSGKDDGPNPPPVNKAPVVEQTFNPVSLAEDSATSVALAGHFSDPEGKPLTYSTSGYNANVHVDVNGTQLNVWSEPNYNGTSTGNVKACDPSNACVSTPLDVTFTAVNDAPVINSITMYSALEGSVLDGQINAADPDLPYGDNLTYLILDNTELPELQVNATTGQLFSDAPLGYNIAGAKNVLIRVDDSLGLLDTNWYVITIANTNRAPTITDVVINQAEEGAILDGDIFGNDPDIDPVTCYFVSSTLPELKVSPGCGIYSDAPLPAAALVNYNVVVGMTDGVMDDTFSRDFEVQRPPFAPGLNPPDTNYVRNEGQLLQFTLVNNGDPNPTDTTILNSPNLPTNATLNPTTGQFSWPMSYIDGGSGGPGTFVVYSIDFQEVDNHGARGPPTTVTVTIYDSIPPP